jgi:putative sterol carrier protein
MTVADDIQEILSKMPQAFVPEKAANINAAIQLDLTGEGGGQWAIKIADGKLVIDEGRAISPNLSLSMAATDYIALTMGDANAMGLFMAGKIKVQGDVMLAMKFQEMFDPDRVDR